MNNFDVNCTYIYIFFQKPASHKLGPVGDVIKGLFLHFAPFIFYPWAFLLGHVFLCIGSQQIKKDGKYGSKK